MGVTDDEQRWYVAVSYDQRMVCFETFSTGGAAVGISQVLIGIYIYYRFSFSFSLFFLSWILRFCSLRCKFMESPQSVVSPLKNSSIYSDPKNHNLNHSPKSPEFTSKKPDPSLGVLDIYVHQARDIQNICIYHKQDVYAKITLTTNPEKSVTTNTINGGGQNPVFNEKVSIDLPTLDTSIKCEIYMLSRVRNYLEDQLLGFTVIPLSDVIFKKVEKEFSLSTNDIFHSPSGFVQLSLSYNGVSPDVIAIPIPIPSLPDSDTPVSDLDKLEFPDPKIANENEMMVSEYIGLSSESLVSSDTDDQTSSENGASFGFKSESPPTSVSTNGSQCDSVPFVADKLESRNQESESESSLKDDPVKGGSVGDVANKPVGVVNLEMDQKVVQQDFVDLYMKSMQQFTESLAKMKLPLDMETEKTSSGDSSSDQNSGTPNGTRPRVFYGSRAFF
ncbi:unnamed protein product [Lactuca virosa]|uniref:C2 domain-containing protein n=1 Tax=Lactuca virosa TaxID=75947 RepID=A0AAU9P2Q8_9ASTR|nr:unnamed protein product [Lactuca virosa]